MDSLSRNEGVILQLPDGGTVSILLQQVLSVSWGSGVCHIPAVGSTH